MNTVRQQISYIIARADKKTADMYGLRYSADDPYYRLGLVQTCEMESITQRLSRQRLVTSSYFPLNVRGWKLVS